MAGVVLALAAGYALAWSTYAYTHLNSSVRYTVLQPGQPAVLPGVSVRLSELTVARALDSYPGDPPTPPDPGAIWVVAELEITKSEPRALCTLTMIGPERRVWAQEDLVEGRDLPGACSLDEIPVDRPSRIEAVFAVPERYANQLIGLGVSSPESWHRAQLLRP